MVDDTVPCTELATMPDARQSVKILVPLTGRMVGAPVLPKSSMPSGFIAMAGLSVSPDGKMVAITFVPDKVTHIGRLADGVMVTSAPATGSQRRFSLSLLPHRV